LEVVSRPFEKITFLEPDPLLQSTAAQTWGILPTTAELVPEILLPSYTYMDEDVVGEAG
jgi:hypothetical protein